jgi:aminopeptidase-like protein
MPSIEHELEQYFDRLWPICRSLTGPGVRETLDVLSELVPLNRYQVASGSKVYDWTVPQEWAIRDAYILTPGGEKIADFKVNNLHVWSYSEPVDRMCSYAELLPHLRTLPAQPDAIPYVTTYYRRTWGFCLDHRTFERLQKTGEYRVVIDSTLADGHLEYGEAVLQGSSDREVLFSTYICHPSMANNELSGPLVQAFLYRLIAGMANRRYTYRFVFAPETIGVIAYLHRVGAHLMEHLDAGYVVTCCGDRGNLTYKQSKRADSLADRAALHVLKHSGKTHRQLAFSVGGSDERQYCSPGFDLPVGSLMRTPYQQYPEYHTSLDNKAFISFPHLVDTVETYASIVKAIELNQCYLNTVGFGEPQLGKRGLYPDSINPDDNRQQLHTLLHLLAFADGKTDLFTIADARGVSALDFEEPIGKCTAAGILEGPC